MTQKEKREEWKRIGLCSTCGKNIPVKGRVTCQKCLDNMKQNRNYKRSHKLCVKCGRNIASPGRKYCDECLEQRHKKYLEESKNFLYKESVKLRYYKRVKDKKENGLCIRCGKLAFENHTLCYEHLIEQRNYMRRRRALLKECKGD